MKENPSASQKTHASNYQFPAFETIMDLVSDGLFITDETGHLLRCNQIFKEWMGQEEHVFQSSFYKNWLDFDPAEHFDPIKEIRRLYSRGESKALAISRDALLYPLDDSDAIDVRVTITPFFEHHCPSDQKQSYFSWHLENLTEIQKANDWQMHQQQMLVQQSKLASLGEMTAAIAHQWKQPLNIINGVLINIFDAFESDDLTESYLRQQLHTASLQGRFMTDTVEDFRSFLRKEPEKHPILVAESIQKALNILHAQLKHQQLEVKLRLSNQQLTVLGKTNELQQVIINLIQNAQDAIEEKSTVPSKQQGVITVHLAQEENEAVLEISNNGIAISEAHKTQLFEPFFSTKTVKGGSGIGLYLSQKLIEMTFNGHLTLKTSAEEETVFQIRMPIHKS